MPLSIRHQNLIDSYCDILVNPTDSVFSGSGGTDLAIHQAAGPGLASACADCAPLRPGEVVETPGFRLQCRHIIHTVGPVWQGGGENEEAILRLCYINALLLAVRLGAKSAAFPLISSGTFGFPKDRVLTIAEKAISDFLYACDPDFEVELCIFDKSAYTLSRQDVLDEYLRENGNAFGNRAPEISADFAMQSPLSGEARPMRRRAEKKKTIAQSLEDWLLNHDDNFAVTLLKLIDKKGMTDVECYKKANLSRKTFSKINTDPNYRPSKPTVIAFAVSLELSLSETEQLLRTVGFTLSHSTVFDLIIEYYISNGIYDILEINDALYKYDQTLLGNGMSPDE